MPAENIDGTATGANQLIDAELEGLSDPFTATYATSLISPDNKVLLLTITPSKGISKDGAQKLLNDLGDKYVDSNGTPVTGPISDAPSKIYIKLMEK